MARLNWEATARDWHVGINHAVFYLENPDGSYQNGVVWNGVRSVTETPTGGEISKIFADNMHYGSMRSQVGLIGTIEAYMYPDEFIVCNGLREPALGARINLQKRKSFGFTYRTMINKKDYQIHIVYGANLQPGEHTYTTVGENADAVVYAWDFFCIPSSYKDKQICSVVIDSRKTTPEKLEYLENILYGTETTDSYLPKLEDLIDSGIGAELRPLLVSAMDTLGIWIWDTFYFPDDSVPRATHRESETRVYFRPSASVIQNRPGIEYDLLNPDTGEYLVITDTIPDTQASLNDAIEDIPQTTLIRTRPSTDGYVFYDYSIIYKEEN